MKREFTIILLFLIFGNQGLTQDFARFRYQRSEVLPAEAYRSMTHDGAWCWFSEPRAVYYEGEHKRTYAGWIDSYGDIHIGYYDHVTQEFDSGLVVNGITPDDHNHPSVLPGPGGYLYVFFSPHATREPIRFCRSIRPEDISEWTEIRVLELNDTGHYEGLSNTYTYTNPVFLSEENNRLYMFWRGIDFKPNISWSDDLGKTWTPGRILILPERIYEMRRPYLKIDDNGRNRIHFAFTDGHPRKESENSIYYMQYHDGEFKTAGGRVIKRLEEMPCSPGEAGMVYDASETGVRAWIWDVAEDTQGNPVVVYAKFPDIYTHIYVYARWDGEKWNNYELVNSGKWFPETMEGRKEPEPHYSAGIVLDHEDPNIVYLSREINGVFEIEQWTTRNEGKSWRIRTITANSEKNNVRPYAIRNAGEDNDLQFLWMMNTRYRYYSRDYRTSIKTNLKYPSCRDVFDPGFIVDIMHKTADWQLANPREHDRPDWQYGAFYTGIWALYETTGEQRYLNEILNIGEANNWKLMNDIYHADRLTIAQVFADAYMETGREEILEKVRWVMDMHVNRTAPADVRFEGNPYRFEWWTWCDALYMAPPAFARVYKATGDQKYLDYLDEHWWITSDYLYDPEEHLFYRDDRFFDARTENGKKVFWSRGNGWVMGGLVRVLEHLPEDHPSRGNFIKQYHEMASKLIGIQGDDGLWRSSLLDPGEYPMGESSGSAFFCYALAWGINQGYLDEEKFLPAVEKAWEGLVNNVNEEGMLGYVQQIGDSPKAISPDDSQVYGTGAFLLAGSEVLKWVK